MSQSKNKSLAIAKINKNDEFYTQYNDGISRELEYYKEQLKGKSILCPCDWDEALNIDNCNFVMFLNAIKEEWGIKK